MIKTTPFEMVFIIRDLMKKKYLLAVCAVILSVLLLCCGCSATLEKLEDKDSRQTTEAMLNALIENDPNSAYSLVSHLCAEDDFKSTFPQMREILGNTSTYELKLLYIQTNASFTNSENNYTISSVYEVTGTTNKFIVNITSDSQVGLRQFYLTPYEKTDYYFNGTLKTIKNANGAQWILLLSNIISIGLAVFAIIDCCRQKFNKKVMWILLLTFGFFTFGTTLSSTGFRLNFTYGWITAYSALIRYGSGTVVLRLMVPVAAIVYFIMRRSLLNKNKVAMVPAEDRIEITTEADIPTEDPTKDSV